jgi:hypothetical protein
MADTLPRVTVACKSKITHGNVTPRNVFPMPDESRDAWRRLDAPWQRLIWARKRWQNETNAVAANAEHAAASLGMKPNTYRAYERPPTSSKAINLNHQTAIRFGRKFKVNWVWLLLGEGSPFDEAADLPPAQARVVRAMADTPEEDQERLADMVEAFLKTGTRG